MMGVDMNSVVEIGRVVHDAELKYTGAGLAVAAFSIAVNSPKKEDGRWVDDASFFDVRLFGKQAENLKQYLLRGKQIAVQGSLKQDRWEKDGRKFSKVVIIADSVELLGGSGDNVRGNYGQNQEGWKKNSVQDNVGGNDHNSPGMDEFPEEILF
jgi:single-strand DNA-binding protein